MRRLGTDRIKYFDALLERLVADHNMSGYFVVNTYTVKKMNFLVTTVFLVLLQCGLYLSADCPKSRFAVGKRLTLRNKRYRIGLSENDSSDATITLSVINSGELTKGQTGIQSSDLTLVKNVGEIYEFKLNPLGKAKLMNKKANPEKNQFIFINIIFNHRNPPFPRVKVFKFGNSQCAVAVKKRVCRQLNESCDNYMKPRDGQRGSEFGLLMLKPVTAGLRRWEVVVGFDTEVNSLLLNQKADPVSQECKKIFTFKNPAQMQYQLPRPNDQREFPYTLEYNVNSSPPKITYIFYGNKICNTSCGTKPVCPVTTPQPKPTTTQAPVMETTTIAPEEETTAQPPVEETTTQAPVEETTTLAPIEETTAQPPVEETTTQAPVEETTTMAPVEATTTMVPEEKTTTMVPEEETTTMVPEEKTTTMAPEKETTTMAPVEETTTMAPVEETTTMAPEKETTTMTPVEETTTIPPEEATTTIAPEEATTTMAPEQETTTMAPEKETTTIAPEEATTTIAPEGATTTMAPEEETTTMAPVEETTTVAPEEETTTTMTPEEEIFTLPPVGAIGDIPTGLKFSDDDDALMDIFDDLF